MSPNTNYTSSHTTALLHYHKMAMYRIHFPHTHYTVDDRLDMFLA